jgi:hypothetical protein
MQSKAGATGYGRKVISCTVASRVRGSDNPQGAEAIAVLEQLNRDAWACLGVDADAPMRRDVAVVVRPAALRQTAPST